MQAASAFNVPWPVLNSVIQTESGWNPNISNGSSGEIGIAQFLPSTAAGLGFNPSDPNASLYGAAQYLSQLYNGVAGGSWANAVVAYNRGPQGFLNNPTPTPQYQNTYNLAQQVDAGTYNNGTANGVPGYDLGTGIVNAFYPNSTQSSDFNPTPQDLAGLYPPGTSLGVTNDFNPTPQDLAGLYPPGTSLSTGNRGACDNTTAAAFLGLFGACQQTNTPQTGIAGSGAAAATTATGGTSSVTSFFNSISNPDTWQRIGIIAIGSIILLAALFLFGFSEVFKIRTEQVRT